MAESSHTKKTPLARVLSPDALPEPEPAHTRRPEADTETGTETCSDQEREATELRDVGPAPEPSRHSRVLGPQAASKSRWYDPVRRFWRHHIRISVPHDDCRDHLGKRCVLRAFLLQTAVLSYHYAVHSNPVASCSCITTDIVRP